MQQQRSWRLTGALVAVIFISLSCSARRPPHCRSRLDRTGFLQELLFPQGPARTPDFDDYTEGSYHVDKLELLEGIRSIRTREHIEGLIVYGPVGMLWSYHVLLFVAEKDGIRLNSLVFPHARITGKATRVLTSAQFEESMAKLTSNHAMVMGVPSLETLRRERVADTSLEWQYSLLLAVWPNGAERLWHSAGDEFTLPEDELTGLTSVLNELLENSTVTYTTSLPIGHRTNICPDHP